jgi:hypothetical protein
MASAGRGTTGGHGKTNYFFANRLVVESYVNPIFSMSYVLKNESSENQHVETIYMNHNIHIEIHTWNSLQPALQLKTMCAMAYVSKKKNRQKSSMLMQCI